MERLIGKTGRLIDLYRAGRMRVQSGDAILGGEPVFKDTRLAVRHIGGMRMSGEPVARSGKIIRAFRRIMLRSLSSTPRLTLSMTQRVPARAGVRLLLDENVSPRLVPTLRVKTQPAACAATAAFSASCVAEHRFWKRK
ncbi:MAG: hypothetical protein ACREFQ_22430 [Stellaceae bacterium]